MTEDDAPERRSPVSALGGSLHSLWEGASRAGKVVRALVAFVGLLALVGAAFRGAASAYVDWAEVQPKLEAHDDRIETLEADTAEINGLLERMEGVEQATEAQRQVLRKLESGQQATERKLDHHTCLLKAIAAGRTGFECG